MERNTFLSGPDSHTALTASFVQRCQQRMLNDTPNCTTVLAWFKAALNTTACLSVVSSLVVVLPICAYLPWAFCVAAVADYVGQSPAKRIGDPYNGQHVTSIKQCFTVSKLFGPPDLINTESTCVVESSFSPATPEETRFCVAWMFNLWYAWGFASQMGRRLKRCET